MEKPVTIWIASLLRWLSFPFRFMPIREWILPLPPICRLFIMRSPKRHVQWYWLKVTRRIGALPKKKTFPYPVAIGREEEPRCRRVLANEAFMPLDDIANLSAETGDREVRLRWDRPPGCVRVEVWRQDGNPPACRAAGSHIKNNDRISVRDRDVVNGRVYGYRVVAIYRDPQDPDGEIATEGLTVIAIPDTPPRPILDLRCSRNGREATLSWTPVDDSEIGILAADNEPAYEPGQAMPVEQAEHLGVPVSTEGKCPARVPINRQGRIVYIPLSVKHGVAVLGRTADIISVDHVTNLKSKVTGKTVILTWTWPEGINEVVVRWDSSSYPVEPNSDLRRAVVTHRAYIRDEGWKFEETGSSTWFFSVYARTSGMELFSDRETVRADPMNPPAVVSYRIERCRTLIRRRTTGVSLVIESHDLTEITDLVLVGCPRTVPLGPDKGEVVLDVPRVRFSTEPVAFPVPDRWWDSGYLVRLFFRNSEKSHTVRLLPAATEHLVL